MQPQVGYSDTEADTGCDIWVSSFRPIIFPSTQLTQKVHFILFHFILLFYFILSSKVISCDQNLNRCCELIELTAKIQGQLFSILNLTAAEGKFNICSVGLSFVKHFISISVSVLMDQVDTMLEWRLSKRGYCRGLEPVSPWQSPQSPTTPVCSSCRYYLIPGLMAKNVSWVYAIE